MIDNRFNFVMVQRDIASRMAIDIFLGINRRDGQCSFVSDILITDVPPAVQPPHCPIPLTEEAAQALMDGLWNAGIRPTDHRDISELIKAKEEHISDLRRAFDTLLRERGVK